MTAAIALKTQRIRRSIAFRARRKARYVVWWLRWGWRPYGAYQRFAMDRLARQDPRKAVGGYWDYLGPLQLGVLKAHGLHPEHQVLDIGCGSLRGGRHLIEYLEPSRYWGLDISPVLLTSARKLVEDQGLVDKQPHLQLTEGFQFREVEGLRFDCVHAFAVFTDVPIGLVNECFANLNKVLAPGGAFFATYVDAERYIPDFEGIGFQYPFATLKDIAAEHGYRLDPISPFPHPRGHRMFVARRA